MSASAPRCTENKSTLRDMKWIDANQKCTVIIAADGKPCGALYSAHPDYSLATASGQFSAQIT